MTPSEQVKPVLDFFRKRQSCEIVSSEEEVCPGLLVRDVDRGMLRLLRNRGEIEFISYTNHDLSVTVL